MKTCESILIEEFSQSTKCPEEDIALVLFLLKIGALKLKTTEIDIENVSDETRFGSQEYLSAIQNLIKVVDIERKELIESA